MVTEAITSSTEPSEYHEKISELSTSSLVDELAFRASVYFGIGVFKESMPKLVQEHKEKFDVCVTELKERIQRLEASNSSTQV